MEKLFESIKKNIKLAVKNVFSALPEYGWFFAALFIVFFAFYAVGGVYANSDSNGYSAVSQEYEYHLAIYGLDSVQADMLYNKRNVVYLSDDTYDVTGIVPALGEGSSYDIYLRLKGSNLEKVLAAFKKVNAGELAKYGSGYETVESPLLTYSTDLKESKTNYSFAMAAVTLLSAAVLLSVFRIRTNHYKFRYGIYMTVGADLRRLVGSSLWELGVIAAVVFLPAFTAANGLLALLYGAAGTPFTVSFSDIAGVFLLVLLICGIAVYLPLKAMALTEPMKLLLADDNSNLINSPRSSSRIYGTVFPQRYEMLTLWRYRGYLLGLVLSAAVFCAVFVCGVYISGIISEDVDTMHTKAEYTVDLTGSGFYADSTLITQLEGIDGVKMAELGETALGASQISSFAAVCGSDTGITARQASVPVMIEGESEDMRAISDVLYIAYTSDTAAVLAEKYDYKGDLQLPLSESGYIVVGNTLNNSQAFGFEPGDTVYIAKCRDKNDVVISQDYTGKRRLEEQINGYTYEYEKLTVAAVVYNTASIPDGLSVYLPGAYYTKLTGDSVEPTGINIYVADGIKSSENEALYRTLRDWSGILGGSVTESGALREYRTALRADISALVLAVAAAMLLVCPIVWFYSQLLFYRRRSDEFDILRCMSAKTEEIKRLHLLGGGVLAGVSFVLTQGAAYLLMYAVFRFHNYYEPLWFSSKLETIMPFSLPWYAVLIAALLSVICGFMSAYLPYRGYKKHQKHADSEQSLDSEV